MKFEYEQAYPRIRCGGILISDDALWNPAFSEFAETVAAPSARVIRGIGILQKPHPMKILLCTNAFAPMVGGPRNNCHEFGEATFFSVPFRSVDLTLVTSHPGWWNGTMPLLPFHIVRQPRSSGRCSACCVKQMSSTSRRSSFPANDSGTGSAQTRCH